MPNVKLYVDETVLPSCRAGLIAALPGLRTMLCDALKVDDVACQFAILSVIAMPDLPRVNVEMHLLPHPDRTRDKPKSLAAAMQSLIAAFTSTHTAVRIATLVPDSYIALK
jgi:hypothetical protein